MTSAHDKAKGRAKGGPSMTSSRTVYNVHIYREMCLTFPGIAARSAEEAASIAAGMPTEEAVRIEDCEGETIAALVDVVGDAEYARSRVVDFEPARLRKAAKDLLAAVQVAKNYLSDDLDESDPDEMRIFQTIADALDKATKPQGGQEWPRDQAPSASAESADASGGRMKRKETSP